MKPFTHCPMCSNRLIKSGETEISDEFCDNRTIINNQSRIHYSQTYHRDNKTITSFYVILKDIYIFTGFESKKTYFYSENTKSNPIVIDYCANIDFNKPVDILYDKIKTLLLFS